MILGTTFLESKSLRLLYPNGGETLKLNSTITIRWSSSGINGQIVIVLYSKGIKYLTITRGTENTGMFRWRIPANIPPGNQYRLRIRAGSDFAINDFSDRDFAITNSG